MARLSLRARSLLLASALVSYAARGASGWNGMYFGVVLGLYPLIALLLAFGGNLFLSHAPKLDKLCNAKAIANGLVIDLILTGPARTRMPRVLAPTPN